MKKYIVKKYILADSIHEAIRKEKSAKPDDVFLDSASEPQAGGGVSVIGFDTSGSEYYYSPVMKKNAKKRKKKNC